MMSLHSLQFRPSRQLRLHRLFRIFRQPHRSSIPSMMFSHSSRFRLLRRDRLYPILHMSAEAPSIRMIFWRSLHSSSPVHISIQMKHFRMRFRQFLPSAKIRLQICC